MFLAKRIALIAGVALTGIGAGASTVLFTTAAFAQQSLATAQPYLLRCWQDSEEILNVRDAQALQSLIDPSASALTLVNADGSRRVLASMGDSLCVVEFTAVRN